jgi:hypothetical protein
MNFKMRKNWKKKLFIYYGTNVELRALCLLGRYPTTRATPRPTKNSYK